MIRLTDLILETGEGTSKPYEFQKWSDEEYGRYYGFTTDKGTMYNVDLDQDYLEGEEQPNGQDEPITVHVLFYAVDPEDYDKQDYQQLLNKGELFRVMATLVKIVKRDLEEHPEVERVAFVPAKGENEAGEGRRAKLYAKYLEKQLPNARVETNPKDNEVTVWVK